MNIAGEHRLCVLNTIIKMKELVHISVTKFCCVCVCVCFVLFFVLFLMHFLMFMVCQNSNP